MPRVQATVVRDGRVLMVKHRHEGEECNVDGVVVRQASRVSVGTDNEAHSFLYTSAIRIHEWVAVRRLPRGSRSGDGRCAVAASVRDLRKRSDVPQSSQPPRCRWLRDVVGIRRLLSPFQSQGL